MDMIAWYSLNVCLVGLLMHPVQLVGLGYPVTTSVLVWLMPFLVLRLSMSVGTPL